MSRKALAITLTIILAIVGGTAYLLVSSDNKAVEEMGAQKTTTTQTIAADEANATGAQAGRYLEYSPSILGETTGTKLLFFHAPWCPQCRALEADIKKQGVPAGVAIIKVDYDSNQELRQRYGVTLQTTLVKVDDAGNLVKKYVAYHSPTLEAVKTNLL